MEERKREKAYLIVTDITYETIPVYKDNGVMGPGHIREISGIIPRVTIHVKPKRDFLGGKESSLKKLIFEGYCNLENSDSIIAYVDKPEPNARDISERKTAEEIRVSKIERMTHDFEYLLGTYNGLERNS
jgi:hypothetical protein